MHTTQMSIFPTEEYILKAKLKQIVVFSFLKFL